MGFFSALGTTESFSLNTKKDDTTTQEESEDDDGNQALFNAMLGLDSDEESEGDDGSQALFNAMLALDSEEESSVAHTAENQNIISRINREIHYYGPSDISPKDMRYLLQFSADEESIFEDDNITVMVSTGNITSPKFAFYVTNNSDEIVRIDLSDSYYTIADSSIAMRAKGGSKIISNSGSKGANVNLGGIARAVGVGGIAGDIASAINVGGSSTSTVSEIIEDDSYIVTLPPHASSYLTDWGADMIIDDLSFMDGFNDVESADWSGYIQHAGDERVFNQYDGTTKISSLITYYKGNAFQDPQTLNMSFHLSKVMGIENSSTNLSNGWSNGLVYVNYPIYPPYTEKYNEILLGASMYLVGESNENSMGLNWSISYARLYDFYEHRYDPGAVQWGFGAELSTNSSVVEPTRGSSYDDDGVQNFKGKYDVKIFGAIGIAGIISSNCKYNMSFRPYLGLNRGTTTYEYDKYPQEEYSSITGGFRYNNDLEFASHLKVGLSLGMDVSKSAPLLGLGVYIGKTF